MVAQLKRSDCMERISLLAVAIVGCHGYPSAVRRRRGRCGCTSLAYADVQGRCWMQSRRPARTLIRHHQTISAQYRRFIICIAKALTRNLSHD